MKSRGAACHFLQPWCEISRVGEAVCGRADAHLPALGEGVIRRPPMLIPSFAFALSCRRQRRQNFASAREKSDLKTFKGKFLAREDQVEVGKAG